MQSRNFYRFLAGSAIVAATSFLAPTAAQAQLVFADNFEAEPIAFGTTSLINFNVTRNNVDAFGPGAFGTYTTTSAGAPNQRYLDLDGSGLAPATNGRIETKTNFLLAAGNYTFIFDLGKNGSFLEVLNTNVGSLFSTTISDARAYPVLEARSFTFNVFAPTNATIVFDQANAGDGAGYVIDNVSLVRNGQVITAAPEPGTMALVAMGLMGTAGIVTRRRKS